ncbi:uncharacterized protein LOC127259693 isoform X2 [Andrographis paniculata]|nr:uncharacterized protein LOC127259693 isoform X2 [Andrographis paniculata]
MARSIKSVAEEEGNFSFPGRIGDFTESNLYKFGEAAIGQSTSDKLGNVPIKKRKHLLQPPLPQTLTPPGCSEHEYNNVEDFSGIELLAAAASRDDDSGNAQCEPGLKRGEYNNVEDFSGIELLASAASREDDSGNAQCESGLKRSESESSTCRNADGLLIQSNSDTVSHNPLGKSVDVMAMPRVNRLHWDLNTPMETWGEPCDASIVGNTSNYDMHVEEDMKKDCSNATQEMSDEATENIGGDVIPDEVVNSDNKKDIPDLVLSSDVQNSVIQATTQDTVEHCIPPWEISETAKYVQCKNSKDSWEACEPPGGTIQGDLSVLTSDAKVQNDGAFDFMGHVVSTEIDVKHDGDNLPNEGSRTLDSYENPVVPTQYCGDPSSSTGKIGSSIDGLRDSDVSRNHNFHAVDGVGSTECQDGYDSPYEDGELRGSILFSLEKDELESECVDYESDGRTDVGSDAVDYHHSPVLDGGSDGSCGNTARSPVSKKSPKDSKTFKQNLRMHIDKDDSKNNEMVGNGSTVGSVTTAEEPMEMNIKENDDSFKRRHLNDKRDMPEMYESASKTLRGRLQSHAGGWSPLYATDGKDAFIQEQRSRLSVLDSHTERGPYHGKPLDEFRPATNARRGVRSSSAYRDSRRQYSSSFQGAERYNYNRARNMVGNLDRMSGPGFHDQGETSYYMSEDLHRTFMRSPEESEDYFGTRKRRVPSAQAGGYRRSRVHYLHRADRDFESLPDEANVSTHFSRSSAKDRNFLPNSGKHVHIPPHRRSRSKSRALSPGPWPSHKNQILSTTRDSRSPYFRSVAWMDRRRASFTKPSFTPDFGEGYLPQSRGRRSSPQHSFRWDNDDTFTNNHSRHMRSPVFRDNQRFHAVGSSGRLKSDEYFKPMFRSEKLSVMKNSRKECKVESNCDSKRCPDWDEMVHRRPNA